jgi:hypothetical protein
MKDPKLITRKRATYIRQGRQAIKKALNATLISFMQDVQTAATFGDLITAAEKPIDQKPMAEAIARIYMRVGADFAKLTIKDLKRQSKKSMPDPIEIDFWEDYFIQYSKVKAAQKITWITNTTAKLYKETVARIIEEAGIEGLSVYNTAKRIQKEIGYQNQYRAERIARTEIVSASNAGTLAGGHNAGIPVLKEWLPIVDDASRPDHADMAGQPPIPMDDLFPVGGGMSAPGDEAGGAEHVINCRCALVIVPDTSYEDIINS